MYARKATSNQSPALFLSAESTHLSMLSKEELYLKEAELLSKLSHFALHPEIAGKILASNVQITHQQTYKQTSETGEWEFTITTPVNESGVLQFPSNKQINDILFNTKEKDAFCLEALMQLLRAPLHLYLQQCVKDIPRFLFSDAKFDKKILESNTNEIIICYDQAECLKLLLEKDFPPAPVRLLLHSPELWSRFLESSHLLQQIADALGVAIIRFMHPIDYSFSGDGDDNKLPAYPDFVKGLIEKGANVNVIKQGIDPAHQTPASAAVSHEQDEVLKLLVAHGAKIDLPKAAKAPDADTAQSQSSFQLRP